MTECVETHRVPNKIAEGIIGEFHTLWKSVHSEAKVMLPSQSHKESVSYCYQGQAQTGTVYHTVIRVILG